MSDVGHSLAIIAVTAAVTYLIRALPFLVFRHGTPAPILYLGKVLPYAIMGMLVVYCLKNISIFTGTHGLPEFLAIAFVALIHKWKHNTLISVGAGTVLYMVLIQMVFV